MRREEIIMSTSRVDSHGDRLVPDAIMDGARQITEFFLPMMYEHDPRVAPRGRIVGATTRELEDGELALVGEVEIFEPEDPVPQFCDEKSMRPRMGSSPPPIFIEYDRSYQSPEYQEDINHIGILLNAEPREYVKKAIDPVSILTVGGAFALGGIFSGFFNQLGTDAYNALKLKLTEIFNRRGERGEECILEFLAVLQVENNSWEVSLLVTNPNPVLIEELFDSGLSVLDSIAPNLIDDQENILRFVFVHTEQGFRLKYALRRDAIPLFPVDDEDSP